MVLRQKIGICAARVVLVGDLTMVKSKECVSVLTRDKEERMCSLEQYVRT